MSINRYYLLKTFVCVLRCSPPFVSFFFNDTATTEIYTLSLHDALPISFSEAGLPPGGSPPSPSILLPPAAGRVPRTAAGGRRDRKSTRLNSSHGYISYAVFCLKKKKTIEKTDHRFDKDRPSTRSLYLTG